VKRLSLFINTIFVITASLAQPATEVYLFDIIADGDTYKLLTPENASNNPGYDNQPYFLPDGSGLLFSSADSSGQTDVILYDIKTKSRRKLTASEGSEYSPTVMPRINTILGPFPISIIRFRCDMKFLNWLNKF